MRNDFSHVSSNFAENLMSKKLSNLWETWTLTQ